MFIASFERSSAVIAANWFCIVISPSAARSNVMSSFSNVFEILIMALNVTRRDFWLSSVTLAEIVSAGRYIQGRVSQIPGPFHETTVLYLEILLPDHRQTVRNDSTRQNVSSHEAGLSHRIQCISQISPAIYCYPVLPVR